MLHGCQDVFHRSSDSISPLAMRGISFSGFWRRFSYGARISGSIVTKTHREFVQRNFTSPQAIVQAGWDVLVEALDAGGYVRYDFKTATKLREVMRNLTDQYRPCWKSFNYSPLNRGITRKEFEEAVEAAKATGLHRLHQERPGSAVAWIAEV